VEGHDFTAVRIDNLATAGSLMLGASAVTAGQVIDVAALGGLVYTPALDANGAAYASFTFSVQDSGGAFDLAPNTITVDVTSVNEEPTGTDKTVSTPEDTPRSFAAADFGFADADGHSLTAVRIDSVATAGSLKFNGTAVSIGQLVALADLGNLVFTPSPNAYGATYASFTFSVKDSGGAFDLAPNTITVDVTQVNDPPTGTDKPITIMEDIPYTFAEADFGFADVDGHILNAVWIGSVPSNGSLKLNGTAVTANQLIAVADLGNLVFTPALNANGAAYANFTFSVKDSSGAFDLTLNTITFNVTPVNDPPTGADKTVTTLEDTPRSFTAADFGFADVDGHSLTAVRIDTVPTTGSLALSGVPVSANQVIDVANLANLSYTPAPNGNGAGYASFTFSVKDLGGEFDLSPNTITVNVTPVNDAPTGINLSAGTVTEHSSVGTVIGTLSAVDVDATDSFTYSLVAGNGTNDADNGRVTIVGNKLQVNGIIDYESNQNLDINVKVTDAGGLSYTEAMTVAVTDQINDIYYGTNGDDSLTGGIGNDILYGYDGNDTLYGMAGNDNLEGGNGNDILIGGDGADFLKGGIGSDTASYASAVMDILASLANAASNTAGTEAFGDTYDSIENLIGGSGNDNLIGNDGEDNILTGGAGGDRLEGGTHSTFGDTASYANATAGVITSLSGVITQTGDAIGDTYFGIENITGSNLGDTLIGDEFANTLTGGVGDDILEGMIGADKLIGGDGITDTGNDTASYAHASGPDGVIASLTLPSDFSVGIGPTVTPSGDAAGDLYEGIENLTGSNYNDTLIGNSGANSLTGGFGNDTLEGMAGADSLFGGGGTADTASYVHAAAGVTASLTSTLASIQTGDAEGDSFTLIENLTGSNYNDTLIGREFVNILTGGDGDDILEGMAGADKLYGDAGSNSASYLHATATSGIIGITASLALPATNNGHAAGDEYFNIQNLIGSRFDDTLTGRDGEDNILTGGVGADILNGGTGTDTASYQGDSADIYVSLTTGPGSGGEAQGDTYFGMENLIGGSGSDILIGKDGANTLNGGLGNDILEGMAGGDNLIGGGGNNTASYEHAGTGVVASLDSRFTPWQDMNLTDSQYDTYSDIQNLTGSSHDDILIGDEHSNILTGGAGNDTLYVDQGFDSGFGGDNNDTFYASSSSDNLPTVIDGGTGTDVIVLQELVGGNYDLTPLANVTNNIDTLNIKDGVNTNILISGQDIQNMVDDGVLSHLTIIADSGDKLVFTPSAGESITPGFVPGVDDTYTISNGGQIAQIQWHIA
jgi:Ca2+-binding RTX toxin-like protein